MFKDKVKVTAVALVMALLMVLSVTTDLFIGLADVFRAKASEATPTDATKVTRDVTVYKELNDSDRDRNLAGAVIKVFKDSECTQSITDFVLSYDGKSYGGDDRVVYKNLEERASADASKAIAKLQEQTYYYRIADKLYKSDKDFSTTGYEYNSVVGSFTVSEGDGVQEVKLDNDIFKPVKKLATATDAKKTETTTEAVSEASSEATPSDASTEDSEEDSEDDSESDTQVATPTDAEVVEPVVTLAAILKKAIATLAAETTSVSRGDAYGYGGGTISYIFYIDKSKTYNNTGYAFCMEEGKIGPTGGTGTITNLNNANITKALYYSFAGQGAGAYSGAPSSGGLNGNNVMALSCILDYYYTGSWDSGNFGTAYTLAYNYASWLSGQSAPVSVANTTFSIDGKTSSFTASKASYDISKKVQTTKEWDVVTKKDVTVTIPDGVIMYKTSNGKKTTHTKSATVSNGDKIYFTASLSKTDDSIVKFTSVTGYDAYMADFGGSWQKLGFLGKPKNKVIEAKIDWNKPNLGLKKTDSKTGQPVANAEYLVYCAQDGKKANVVRFKTNGDGVGVVTSINPAQAEGAVGDTVVKIKANVRYYIVETKAPEHYKLNENKQITIGDDKYPYEAYVGVSSTNGHVDYTSITGATFGTTSTGVTYHTVDKVAHDPVNIVIDKVDSVKEDGTTVGGASLAGAVFKMEYFKGKDSASGSADNTWYIRTVKNSRGDYEARFARGYLYSDSTYKSDAAPTEVDPSGIYELEAGCMRITEVKSPSGYLKVDGSNNGYFEVKGKAVEGVSSITVRVTGGKTIYADNEITADDFKQYEQKKRYHFKFKKVDKYGKPMAGVAFVITASDGTQHVVVTDKNGEYDSSKTSYTNVNGNDAELAKALKDTSYFATYKTASVFFTTPGSGKTAAAEIKEDTVGGKAPGPLYKGRYTIRELHRQYVTVDGVKRKVTDVYDIPETKEFTVGDSVANGATIDFGEFDNYAKESMTSTAMDTDTATKMSVTSSKASFTDSVVCKGLKASKQYTLMSIAVNRSTGRAYRDASGKLVAKNQVFTSNANKEKADLPETKASVVYTGINTTGTEVNQLTFYEYLVEGNVSDLVSVGSDGKPVEPANCVASDADTGNAKQTVNLVRMETSVLVNSTGSNEAPATIGDITDEVSVHNLIKGEKFQLESCITDGTTTTLTC